MIEIKFSDSIGSFILLAKKLLILSLDANFKIGTRMNHNNSSRNVDLPRCLK